MQELEKILEEMKESSITVATSKEHYIHPQDGRFVEEVVLLDDVEKIIRKHMNDGWIPVEERLPEEAGTYIINALTGERNIVTFAKWQNRYKRFDMTGARTYWKIIAWRPLPEPYRPERSMN